MQKIETWKKAKIMNEVNIMFEIYTYLVVLIFRIVSKIRQKSYMQGKGIFRFNIYRAIWIWHMKRSKGADDWIMQIYW